MSSNSRKNLFVTPEIVNKPVKKGGSITRVVIMLDESGSMISLTPKVKESFAKQIAKLRESQVGETFVSVGTFQTEVKFQKMNLNINSSGLDDLRYSCNGWTALNDGIGKSIDLLQPFESIDDAVTDDWGYLIIVMTDGEENQSSLYKDYAVRKMIELKQKGDHYTFCMLVPQGTKAIIGSRYVIPLENITEWDGKTEASYGKVQTQTLAATQSYMASRAAGQTKTASFYSDASNLDPKKDKLVDVTTDYKSHKIDKETDITSFYQYKTGKNYSPAEGKAFYTLMKRELIQPDKEIVVRDKVTKRIFGGDVRKALNMVPQSGTILRVSPGNHANWDIFVQSKSPNRKLVRGTDLLVRK